MCGFCKGFERHLVKWCRLYVFGKVVKDVLERGTTHIFLWGLEKRIQKEVPPYSFRKDLKRLFCKGALLVCFLLGGATQCSFCFSISLYLETNKANMKPKWQLMQFLLDRRVRAALRSMIYLLLLFYVYLIDITCDIIIWLIGVAFFFLFCLLRCFCFCFWLALKCFTQTFLCLYDNDCHK